MKKPKYRILDRGEIWAFRYYVQKKVWWWPFWVTIHRSMETTDECKTIIERDRSFKNTQVIEIIK